jgi:chitinase
MMFSVRYRSLDPMHPLVRFCTYISHDVLELKLSSGNLCGTSRQPQATAQSALAQWTKAGFPASKLLLGLALYGYVSKSTAKKLFGSLMPDPSVSPAAHPRAPPKELSVAPAGDLSSMWGQQIAFKQLVQAGALQKKADGSYIGANGYTHGRSTVLSLLRI